MFNGKLYFTAYHSSRGLELFSFDGTNPPALEHDILVGSGSSTPVRDASYFSAAPWLALTTARIRVASIADVPHRI